MLLVGCGGGATTSPGDAKGGLYGTVTRGPTTPVCRKGIPCTEPASGAQLVFSQGDRVAARVVVAKDGSYSVSLSPGTYSVGVETPSPIGGGLDPSTIRVTAGPRERRDFQIDTGIR